VQQQAKRPEAGMTSVDGAAQGSDDSAESEESAVEEPPAVDPDGPMPDDVAKRLAEWQEVTLQKKVGKMKRKKQRLEKKLLTYQHKEQQFVNLMDHHMDDVERKEHDLQRQIDTLTAENQQLRSATEKRARDNTALADKLSDTTKQCSEAETRVQFLVDRIVALLSAGSGDPTQTEAVVNMRGRERELLKQLDETRQQFDEVRMQNGELTSRLTEELTLSRRLQDQLAEVEERFFQHGRSGQALGEDGVLPIPGGRLGGRPLGLRSDQTEALPPGSLPERVERPGLPELPPPISEVEVEDNAVPFEDAELQEVSEEHADSQELREAWAEEGDSPNDAHMTLGPRGSPAEDDAEGHLTRVPNGTRHLPTIWPTCSRTTSAEDVRVMEQKLKEALDKAHFECQVVRIENGIYEFGPKRAVVELTPDHQVVASAEGKPWEPIDLFIQNIREETRYEQMPAALEEAQSLSTHTPGLASDSHHARSTGSSLSALAPASEAGAGAGIPEASSQCATPQMQAAPMVATMVPAAAMTAGAVSGGLASPQVAHYPVMGTAGCYSAAAPTSPSPAARLDAANPRTISPRGVAIQAMPQGVATSQGLAPQAAGIATRQGRGVYPAAATTWHMPATTATPERVRVSGRPATPIAGQLHAGYAPRRDARPNA